MIAKLIVWGADRAGGAGAACARRWPARRSPGCATNVDFLRALAAIRPSPAASSTPASSSATRRALRRRRRHRRGDAWPSRRWRAACWTGARSRAQAAPDRRSLFALARRRRLAAERRGLRGDPPALWRRRCTRSRVDLAAAAIASTCRRTQAVGGADARRWRRAPRSRRPPRRPATVVARRRHAHFRATADGTAEFELVDPLRRGGRRRRRAGPADGAHARQGHRARCQPGATVEGARRCWSSRR